MLLNKDVGLVNSILATLGFGRISFLLDKENALPTIAALSIWKNVGYSVIILVAGLRGVAAELYDAAIVDGANAWDRFVHVTLPMIRRQIMFVMFGHRLVRFRSSSRFIR